jgi:hypothetical protein
VFLTTEANRRATDDAIDTIMAQVSDSFTYVNVRGVYVLLLCVIHSTLTKHSRPLPLPAGERPCGTRWFQLQGPRVLVAFVR